METRSQSFTEGKILGPLIRFSLPVFFAIFLQAMYGAVDLWVVGKFGDASGISAVATGSQIMQTITGIITGLTMGVTVLLGQRIGEKRLDEAGNVVGTSICLFAAVAAVLTVVMLFSAQTLAKWMQAPEQAFEKTVAYVRICSCGTLFIVMYNVISGILRGLGNSRMPLLFVGIACITNIIGDLVFVALLHMDASGAALATVLAQAVSVVLSVLIIRGRGLPFPFGRKNIRFRREETLGILRLGAPIALQDSMTNVSFLAITAILNGLGLVASAAVGVAEKVIVFVMLVPIAYMSSVSAFVAQNIGARQYGRAKTAMKYAMATSLAVGIPMFLIAFFWGEGLAGLFANDGAVMAATGEYLKTYSFDCILVCILFCFMGYFNGCGKTMFVMVQGVIAAFAVRIPVSYLISRLPEVTMLQLGLATPVSTVAGILMCFFYYRRLVRTNTITGGSYGEKTK